MKIEFDDDFWYDKKDDKSRVFQVFPSVFGDDRGTFTEIWKCETTTIPENMKEIPWFADNMWIKQLNVSHSRPGVIRGCHAQTGNACQGKLVQSMFGNIWDVITDARPQSDTFMMTKVFFLNPRLQNKVFVPRGFLHAFITGNELPNGTNYIFSYICDAVYDKTSEICVSPLNIVIPAFYDYCERYGLENFVKNGTTLLTSPKDEKGQDPDVFFEVIRNEYKNSSTLWYK